MDQQQVAANGGGHGAEAASSERRRHQEEEATDRLRDFDATIRPAAAGAAAARPEAQRPREAPPGHPGSRGGGARAGSATAEQQAYWWGPGGPKVNDRDLLEFDLFVEMHLRQQQEQQLLSRLQRPAAAPSEGERHGVVLYFPVKFILVAQDLVQLVRL